MTIKGSLTAMLPDKYQTLGYQLSEDEDFVYLLTPDKKSVVFSSHGVVMSKIEEVISKREILLNIDDYWLHIGHADTD
jgi:hypothetical protein